MDLKVKREQKELDLKEKLRKTRGKIKKLKEKIREI
jgi:hypothetical protein